MERVVPWAALVGVRDNVMMTKRVAAILFVLCTQTAFAAERWVVLGHKADGTFSLDTNSVVKNDNVRMGADIKEAHVKIEWSDASMGYDQLDSTLLFDCDEQAFGYGEETFRLDGNPIRHVMYDDFAMVKIAAEVTVKVWEKACGKTFDRTDLAQPRPPISRDWI